MHALLFSVNSYLSSWRISKLVLTKHFIKLFSQHWVLQLREVCNTTVIIDKTYGLIQHKKFNSENLWEDTTLCNLPLNNLDWSTIAQYQEYAPQLSSQFNLWQQGVAKINFKDKELSHKCLVIFFWGSISASINCWLYLQIL